MRTTRAMRNASEANSIGATGDANGPGDAVGASGSQFDCLRGS